MVNKIVVGVLAVMVASIVLIASLPIYGGLSETSVSVENEGAGELRFSLADNHAEYNISVTWGDDNITVANGTDTQAVSYDNPTILYADENLAVWYDGNEAHILAPEGDGYATGTVGDDLTIIKNSAGLSVTIGEGSPVSYSAPAWAYIANSAGKYGYFEDGTEIKTPTNNRLAVVGSFAGVYCYNQYNNYDLPISLELTQEGNVLSGAKWVKALQDTDTNLEPFDPSDITITPLDPGVIDLDPEPDASIMYVPPTPTYTDGDWGYNLKTIDGVQKAIIVSYSGTGGNIVTPATVGGYDVYQIGLGERAYQLVVNNANISAGSTLTITNGPKIIGQYAFYACDNFTGNLTIPASVETIGENAFNITSTGGFTTLTLSQGLKHIGEGAFYASGLTGGLTIPDTVETIGVRAFSANSGFTGDLIIPDSVTSIGESAFSQFGYNNVPGSALYLPSNLTIINKNTFSQCGFSTIAKWPDNLETIGEGAFSSFNKKLTSLNIPEGVKTIGKNAFKSSLGSSGNPITVTLPSSLETIGEGAFYINYMGDTLILWDKITDIGSYAFSGTYVLDNLVIMSNPTIGNNAFNIFRALSEVANLGGADLTSSVQDWGANVVIKDNIPALGYISAVEFTEVGQAEGAVYDLLNLVPLLSVFGLVLGTIAVFLIRRV